MNTTVPFNMSGLWDMEKKILPDESYVQGTDALNYWETPDLLGHNTNQGWLVGEMSHRCTSKRRRVQDNLPITVLEDGH